MKIALSLGTRRRWIWIAGNSSLGTKILSYDLFFFFFHWHYDPLWALACRTMSLHFVLSVTNSLHLLSLSSWKSLSTSSFHPFLGRPLRFIPSSSCVKIFFGHPILLHSLQVTLCPFIHFTVFSPLLIYSSSRFVLIFRSPFSYVVPYIFLNIFLSKISRACSSFFVIPMTSVRLFTLLIIKPSRWTNFSTFFLE